MKYAHIRYDSHLWPKPKNLGQLAHPRRLPRDLQEYRNKIVREAKDALRIYCGVSWQNLKDRHVGLIVEHQLRAPTYHPLTALTLQKELDDAIERMVEAQRKLNDPRRHALNEAIIDYLEALLDEVKEWA